MKNLILTQKINSEIINQGFDTIKQKCASIGLLMEFTFRETARKFSSVPYSVPSQPNGYQINPQQILEEEKLYGNFDEVSLIYNNIEILPKPTNPTDNADVIQLPDDWYGISNPQMSIAEKVAVFAEFYMHELSHFFAWKYSKPDLTHNYDPAFSSLPRIDWYLHLIQGILSTPTPTPVPSTPTQTYNFFKMTEFTDSQGKHTFSELDPPFRSLLDKMRGECGFSWRITSGYRTVAENSATPGAVVDSSHTDRIAVDIYCIDSSRRDKIVNVAKANGITRIGIGKDFVHLDIDKTKPQNVMWTYY